MEFREYMEGYDRSFDQKEFDDRLWEAMQDDDFEFGEDFEYFLREYGISDTHEFLKTIRMRKRFM